MWEELDTCGSFNPLVSWVQKNKNTPISFNLNGLICKGNNRFWRSLLWALGTNMG